MIDGIDVNGCKHFKNGTCLADYLLTDMDFSEAKCELCKDCYYKQLARKTQECEELRRSILKIFACLIKANKDKIIDTLWVDNVTTLWDYVALTLGVEGDQTQIEEQIIQKIREISNDR